MNKLIERAVRTSMNSIDQGNEILKVKLAVEKSVKAAVIMLKVYT